MRKDIMNGSRVKYATEKRKKEGHKYKTFVVKLKKIQSSGFWNIAYWDAGQMTGCYMMVTYVGIATLWPCQTSTLEFFCKSN